MQAGRPAAGSSVFEKLTSKDGMAFWGRVREFFVHMGIIVTQGGN